MTACILVADDEQNITDVCRRYLEREGYVVWVAHDGEEALRLWMEQSPDLLVLDLMMPGIDGWEVCEKVREAGETPVILLTARGEEPDRLLGLSMGADDYMTKPFSPRELVLRVKNILRRVSLAQSPHKGLASEEAQEALHFDGLSIFPSQRRVKAAGSEVDLTAKEFDLLFLLACHSGQVFSRSQLLKRIWHTDYNGDTTTVTVLVRRLREKIELDPSQPRWIKTVWGIGYKLDGKEPS
ncbi:response regulator transcription factor [Desulfosporosinus hippei]|uniref:Stage 0 sporulation protein A homolog n=1 Tax=Desulfosporosinus hippei DSM 8344 TaxID=1121419 RepID=A0A1G8DZ47_9FIRM|nr:response regulator transcription factor [Desulfosporosinus hippei]SDH62878.1 DNA-binding response regulator, OmpR family, contains REC and winged-helix (wHTH) domain [Desulfosporosinus hippei DSM 8344]